MEDAAGQLDCTRCGACCCVGLDVVLCPAERDEFVSRPALVRLTVGRRFGGHRVRVLAHHSDTGRCVALRGPLGDVYCAIYSDRPALCRDFERGSPDCLSARERMGFPKAPSAAASADAEPSGGSLREGGFEPPRGLPART